MGRATGCKCWLNRLRKYRLEWQRAPQPSVDSIMLISLMVVSHKDEQCEIAHSSHKHHANVCSENLWLLECWQYVCLVRCRSRARWRSKDDHTGYVSQTSHDLCPITTDRIYKPPCVGPRRLTLLPLTEQRVYFTCSRCLMCLTLYCRRIIGILYT